MWVSKLTDSPGAGRVTGLAGSWPASRLAGGGGAAGGGAAGGGGGRGGRGGGLARRHVREHRGEQRVGRDVLFVQQPGGPRERAQPARVLEQGRARAGGGIGEPHVPVHARAE